MGVYESEAKRWPLHPWARSIIQNAGDKRGGPREKRYLNTPPLIAPYAPRTPDWWMPPRPHDTSKHFFLTPSPKASFLVAVQLSLGAVFSPLRPGIEIKWAPKSFRPTLITWPLKRPLQTKAQTNRNRTRSLWGDTASRPSKCTSWHFHIQIIYDTREKNILIVTGEMIEREKKMSRILCESHP